MSVQKLGLTNVLEKVPSQTETETRVKPTVATILREKKVADVRHAIERQELESLMCGGMSPENYLYWLERRREEEERRNEEKIEERKLAAKLANQRILEIGRHTFHQKKLKAQRVREEEIELKQELALRNGEEMDCARKRVDKILLDEVKSQMALLKIQNEKKINARQVQKQTETLREKGQKAKEKEDALRKEKIKRIQAQAVVSHRIRQEYTLPFDIRGHGINCEMSDTEAKFRIHLQKCEDEARISETRSRVQAEKIAKKERLDEALQKISAYHHLLKERHKYKIS